MKKIYYILILAAVSLAFNACDSEEDLIDERKADNPLPGEEIPTGESGAADFTTYVSIGNSLTAGFMDNALYTDGQQNSFPNILAGQFRVEGVGGGAFNQPDINSNNGFNSAFSDLGMGLIRGRLVLDLDLDNDPSTSDAGPKALEDGELPTPFTGDKGTLNNFGVPGVLLGQVLSPATGGPAEGNPLYNGLYARFASNPGVSTILGDAITRQPTFFTLWIGNNDVLGYAISGASNEAIFTSPTAFDAQYESLINTLLSNTEANGIVINIPPVTTIPFFQAVPRVVSVPEASRAELSAGLTQLNTAINGWNMGVQANPGLSDEQKAALLRPTLNTDLDNYPLVIEDLSLSDAAVPIDDMGNMLVIPKVRNIDPTPGTGELLPFPASQEIPKGTGISPATPLGDEFVLTKEEITTITERAIAFNTTIATLVAQNSDRLKLYDINPLFLDLVGLSDGEVGIVVDGIPHSPDFRPSGVFSTDGVHINPRGNAIVTNELIDLINREFGASIPKVDIQTYRTVLISTD
ncbi:hypothetical protein FNH22_26985 [Fulvivirga sp. M361]|uniref:hypothetical protein n=1 Tax=Fulvivirga sp. M361 TaxID=2594266 RepID=UPI00117A5855|nr:hypothetical protein [Fulvivirga sp. M361]TRX49464.1 hypothetical protein FNH22_26985 [Fulvivirga sp. M361]